MVWQAATRGDNLELTAEPGYKQKGCEVRTAQSHGPQVQALADHGWRYAKTTQWEYLRNRLDLLLIIEGWAKVY